MKIAFWRRKQRNSELNEEIRAHLALAERDARESAHDKGGADPQDAPYAARREFGNATLAAELTRDQWPARWLFEFSQDARFGLRMLRKNPGFTAVAVLTLALGIGATTAIFSVVYGIVFRPLPYPHSEKLVSIGTRELAEPDSFNPASLPDLKDWQSQNKVFSSLAGYAYNRYDLDADQGGGSVRAAMVTPEFFPMLGVNPLLGRELGPADDRAPVAVLGYQLWQQVFHGDPNVVGKNLRLRGHDFQVVGVMPASFRLPTPDVSVWLSLADVYATSNTAGIADWITSRSLRGYWLIGRLKDGVTLSQAQWEMDAIEARLGQIYPKDDKGFGAALVPLQTQIVGGVQHALLLFLGAVGLVLLISCVNVGNLLLAKAAARRREIALRHALGGGAGRLIRQVLTESAVLGAIGTAVGIALAFWTVQILLRLIPQTIPRLQDVRIDGPVLLFALAVAFVTTLVFGLAPARRLSRISLNDVLREDSRGATSGSHNRTRSFLVSGEIALATVLVVGAALLLQSFVRLAQLRPILAPDRLITFELGASLDRYTQPIQQAHFFDQILQNLRAIPSVVAAGACTSMPPDMYQQMDSFSIPGRTPTESGQRPIAIFLPATPGFFQALGLPLLAGRDFTAADIAGAPSVAIINAQVARRYFRNDDPLGQKMTFSGVDRTIVGVVSDTTYEGLGSTPDFQIYVPYAQSTSPGMYIAVRSAARDPLALAGAVASAIHAVDPQARATHIASMEQRLSESIVQPRFYAWLLSSFGAIALTLASIGIFSLVSYSVSQRTREIGIRMALGAGRAGVMRMILSQIMTLTLSGVAIGVAAALAANRVLGSLLFGVKSTDALSFAAVSVLLAATSLLACYLPVRRAMRVDPIVALRHE
jgi:putative ABC transport system permease protein